MTLSKDDRSVNRTPVTSFMKKSLCPAIALALNASAHAQSQDPKPSDLGKRPMEEASVFAK